MRTPCILLVNPNSTTSMTVKAGMVAEDVVGDGIRIWATNPTDTPPAIQGPEDGEAALPGLYRVIDEALACDPEIAAVIIACFDDTGLWHLREKLSVPVIGIGEAAYHMASLAAGTFSVVTTLSVSVPVLEDNLQMLGLANRCAKVRASEVPVLELEDPESDARQKIEAEIERALSEDGAGAIALGCAGMADLAADLSRKFQVPVIDGVASAVKLAEILISQKA